MKDLFKYIFYVQQIYKTEDFPELKAESVYKHSFFSKIRNVLLLYFSEVTQFDSYTYDSEQSIGLRVPWICTDHFAALFTTKGPGFAC